MKEDYTDRIKCPLCKYYISKNKFYFKSPIKISEQYEIRVCPECKHLFTNPLPSVQVLDYFYNSDSFSSHLLNSNQNEYIKKENVSKWELIRKFKSSGLLLDIGCGVGNFISLGKNYNFEVAGIEGSNKLADYGKNTLGLNITETSLENCPEDFIKADVITLWDVLEHIKSPKRAIDKLKKFLKPDGIIIVGVPNANSLDASIFGPHWIGFWVPLHLHHFSPKILRGIFKEQNTIIIHEEYKNQPYIINESYNLLAGKDSSEMGAFQGIGGTKTKIIRKILKNHPSLNTKCQKIIVKVFNYLSCFTFLKNKCSYMIFIIKNN